MCNYVVLSLFTVVGRHVTWSLKCSCNDAICQLQRQLKDFNESHESMFFPVFQLKDFNKSHEICYSESQLVFLPCLSPSLSKSKRGEGIVFMNCKTSFVLTFPPNLSIHSEYYTLIWLILGFWWAHNLTLNKKLVSYMFTGFLWVIADIFLQESSKSIQIEAFHVFKVLFNYKISYTLKLLFLAFCLPNFASLYWCVLVVTAICCEPKETGWNHWHTCCEQKQAS